MRYALVALLAVASGAFLANSPNLGFALLSAAALLPLAKSGGRVSRWEGAALLATYVGYTAWSLARAGA